MSVLVLNGSNVVPWGNAPAGAMEAEVVFGRDDAGAGAMQVGTARLATRPTKGVLDELWKSRGTKAPTGFIVAAVTGDGVWIHYPSTDAPPIGPVTVGQAERQLQSVLDEPHGLAAHGRIRAIQEAFASAGTAGFSNHFLFATYHLNRDVPGRADWQSASERAAPILSTRGAALVKALGFSTEPAGSDRLLVLRTDAGSGSRRAVAVLLKDEEQFDQKSAAYQLTPVAKALEVAGREDVPWVIALRKSTLRLYPGRDGVGVGQRGQSETYFELDLDLLAPEQSALLPLIFSAEALDLGGSTQQILEGSGKYAAELGTRLRDRVYEGVVPGVALAIADRLPSLGLALDADGLQTAYRLTMRVLFRLLFQAYGEATELLPAGRNVNYDANSLQAFIAREIGTGPDQFSTESAAIWSDLSQVWEVIFHGNPRWEVPAYGGSLFDPGTEEGALLKRIELPDSVIGPALQELLSEETVDRTWGPVDFRSLQVREFGTIYEGLLESSLSLAEQDLTVDRAGAYVPAKEGDEVVAPAGHPYFHSASGERKATGSYYTPKLVVDHLIDRSVQPALEAHLAGVASLLEERREREAADTFFDFRVADLAMGSAHFLVAAVDKIERGMRDFLTARDVPGVRAELARLSEKAREALGPDTDGANAITDGQLLRRQIARRCVYGLDVNPLAVELARLALWIHTFVPGLPMSSLDHGLVLANSLTGIGTIGEAIGALHADGLFETIILEPLATARDVLTEYATASEADKSEVAAGATMLERAREAAAPARAIFDVALAKRLGLTSEEVWDSSAFVELANKPHIRVAIAEAQPAHMPYLFPEVFLRERPGFDVLLGNPPWETVKVEEHKWWGLRIPGLRSLPQNARRKALAEAQTSRPDLMTQYRAEVARTDLYATALRRGPYPLGAGDIDLVQAFAWRYWTLIRSGGRSGVVLPRSALSGSPLEPWRRSVLEGGGFVDVCFVTNSGNWVFDNVDGRYTVAFSVIEKGDDHVVRFAGPFYSRSEFNLRSADLGDVPAQEFASWSATCAFPLMPDPDSTAIFRRMKRQPRFDEQRADWHFKLTNELHSTNDRPLYQFDLTQGAGNVAILGGSSINLWTPDFGEPFAYSEPTKLRAHLRSKLDGQRRNSRSAYFGVEFAPDVLPMDQARIGFRKIARSTDSRTTLACLIPPGVGATEGVQLIVRSRGDERSEAFLLGVLSSIPFDWAARRWVELNFNFFVMQPLPVPRFVPDQALCDRIVRISGRLAAVDDRYSTWASAVGVEVGSVDEESKAELVAELDALVGLLYDLSEEQFQHVFATFHRGWDYSPRLEKALAYFAQWKDAA